MTIYRLVYVSTANPELTIHDLDQILDTARARNEASGLTGLLVFNGFNFMQYLEGPASALEAVFDAICRDPRHSGVVRVFGDTAEDRLFPAWTMAYARTSTSPGTSAGALNLTTEALKAYLPEDLSPELHMLFVSFNTMSTFGLTPAAAEGFQPAQ